MFGDFLNLMAMAPKLLESLQKMSDEEVTAFVDQLGLVGEERQTGLKILIGFKRGEALSGDDRMKAIELLSKVALENNLNLDEFIKR